ncbi:MAG: hypothetical protein WEE89_22555 [Gemmatimonadota bacterium]
MRKHVCILGRLQIILAALTMGVGTSACSSNRIPSTTREDDPRVARDLRQLRLSTAPFRTLDAAATAGYAGVVKDCLVHEHHGAMGYHHVNASVVDARLDLDRPEILLYERISEREYRLNGMEFIVPYRVWPRDSVAPLLMGQSLKHEDNLKIWYLHVWAWKENPNGLFADFHPAVKCPAEGSKIFRPSGGAAQLSR